MHKNALCNLCAVHISRFKRVGEPLKTTYYQAYYAIRCTASCILGLGFYFSGNQKTIPKAELHCLRDGSSHSFYEIINRFDLCGGHQRAGVDTEQQIGCPDILHELDRVQIEIPEIT